MFNENWYTPEQAVFLQTLLKKVKNIEGLIIEIGCWEGFSTSYMANEAYPENVICNDTWLGNIDETNVTKSEHITLQILKKRDVYEIFLENMKNLTRGNYIIEKRDCFELLNEIDKPIKFCHIDACHDYFSVKKTIEILLPKLADNAILCGDDFLTSNMGCLDLYGGVERAVRELLPNYDSYGNLWFWTNVK